MVIQTTLGVILLFIRGRLIELTRERKQIRWLLWGFAIGATPYVFLRTLPSLFGAEPLLAPHVDRLLEFAIPIAFIFAVVRHQFLDIDIIIRRSLIYGSLAAIMVLLYLVFGITLGHGFQERAGGYIWLWLIALGLLAGMGFNPLRRSIGRWVDRTFFKIEHNYGQALHFLEETLAAVADQGEVAEILADEVSSRLLPQRLAIVLRAGRQYHVAGDSPAKVARSSLKVHTQDWSHAQQTYAARHSTSLPEVEVEDFPDLLDSEHFVLVTPINQAGVVYGLILLGRRKTERRYVDQDISYLDGCADLAAAALERLMLVQTANEEAMARQRLDELNRLKNDFLSRVAHDLRTPLASISWSTQNLLDGVVGDLNPSQADYLESTQRSVAYLNRLVGNLLEISRIEKNGLVVELERVELAAILKQAILTLEPVAASKQVILRSQEPDPGVAVRAHADKLLEVVINLLDNAIKYAPPKSQVEMSVERQPASSVAMSVRDHGPGLEEDKADSLFACFEQGAPSPHSPQQGFGLGLYIVKTYLDLMSGEVTAANHPDGGAIFTCHLREDTFTPEGQ
jgi:K+-sensing histidine kinase KdpD